jgi:hypothetical protein
MAKKITIKDICSLILKTANLMPNLSVLLEKNVETIKENKAKIIELETQLNQIKNG